MLLALALGIAALFFLLLVIAALTFSCPRMFLKPKMPFFRCCWKPDDLEVGPDEHPVAVDFDGGEAESKLAKVELDVPQQFTWTEVESLTGSIATAAVIGEGGFSTVYLGRFRGSDATNFLSAVKINRPSERLHREFRQELDVLRRLRHPHIVRLLGFCDEREEGVLLLEYLPNGSLQDKLHSGDGGCVLTWTQRMLIVYRLAQALEYLHDGCDPQIVHGDIKASNVLLDESLAPKLCDFGSARVGFSAAIQPPSSSFAARSAARQMMGSPGYVDPYYLRSGLLSKKSDVYSFGVLLLEMITGSPAYDSEREHKMLAAAMRAQLKAGFGEGGRAVEEVVDRRLHGRWFDGGEAAAAAEVARMCIGENPSLRPSMAEVVRILGDKLSSSISTVAHESNGSNN